MKKYYPWMKVSSVSAIYGWRTLIHGWYPRMKITDDGHGRNLELHVIHGCQIESIVICFPNQEVVESNTFLTILMCRSCFCSYTMHGSMSFIAHPFLCIVTFLLLPLLSLLLSFCVERRNEKVMLKQWSISKSCVNHSAESGTSRLTI